MSYEFTTDSIEVRSLTEGRIPRYTVKGRGMASGVSDTYKFAKRPDGTYKTFHSMFTDNCLKSIKTQASHKRLFVDAQHDLALNINIRSMLKEKLSKEELAKVNNMLKMKELPLAKINDIDINNNSLMVDTELNPAFRSLDKEHEAYFDSVWYSLKNKFLNGISVNFANPKVIENNDGNMVIDDVEVLGFSYVDAPASHENSIMEVAIRAMSEGEKMTENEKPTQDVEAMKKDVESMKSELEGLKAERAKAEVDAKQKLEQDEQKSVEQQKEEQKKTIEELQKKVDDLSAKKTEEQKKQEEMNSAKGTVAQKDKYSGQNEKKTYDKKFYAENINELTEGHRETMESIKKGLSPTIDRTMEGFAELSNLQKQINNPTAGMKFENPADEEMARKLLGKTKGDILIPTNKIE